MNFLSYMLTPDLLAATLRISTPIILAAMGGLLCMRARIFNIALEGFMLIGAFFAIAVIEWTHGSVWLGLLGGTISGIIAALLYGFVIIKLRADQIVVGIAINLLGYGLSSFLLKALFDSPGAFRPEIINKIPEVNIPFLENIPYIGDAFAHHSLMVYFSFLVVLISYILLFKTPFGLAVQSIGEEPDAAKTAGIRPEVIQIIVIIWSGALCGLAGAHLSSGIVSGFIEDMVQGRGFTAFTAIVFGVNHPIWTFFASVLFGFADALGIRIEIFGSGIPPSILKMFPYILSILVLTIGSAVRSKQNTTLIGRVF